MVVSWKKYWLLAKEKWLEKTTLFATILLVLAFLSITGFIFYSSWPIFEEEGLSFLLQSDWNPGYGQFGLLSFLISTFWTVFFSMLLVIFFTVFVALFISKFLPIKLKAAVLFFIHFLSGIPSVCFGLFGAFVFLPIFSSWGIEQTQSMLAAIFVLTLMVLPTTLALAIDLFDNVPDKYQHSAYALGLNKTTVAFKITKLFARKKLWIILFFGFCKVIGEVTAISLIAGNSSQSPPLDQGFVPFFFSSITTLSSLIGLEIGENFGNLHEAALYTSSLLLILIVLIVDLLLMTFLHLKVLHFLPKKTFSLLQTKKNLFLEKIGYYKINYFYFKISNFLKRIIMPLAFLFIMAVFIWIVGDIIIKGLGYFQPHYLVATSGSGAQLTVLIVTTMLILTTIIFSSPLAFLVAIFLVYYGKSNFLTEKITRGINYFIYQFSSLPTVIFGMFGLTLFVSLWGLGYSILAGALTMVFIVLPITIRVLQQNLESFPPSQYYSAHALGLRKKTIILKLILPTTFYALLISFVFVVNKIISESSPILLTMGSALSLPRQGVYSGGRTLSSHIYLLQSEGIVDSPEKIVYQTALLTLVLLFLFNLTVYWLKKKQNDTIKE